MTISTTCGDFSNPSTPNYTGTVIPGCYIKDHTSASSGPLQWRKDTTCILQDGKDYYLNIISADITNVQPNAGGTATSKCSNSACTTPVDNGGSFSSYTFP